MNYRIYIQFIILERMTIPIIKLKVFTVKRFLNHFLNLFIVIYVSLVEVFSVFSVIVLNSFSVVLFITTIFDP